jgi:hypothetical protein
MKSMLVLMALFVLAASGADISGAAITFTIHVSFQGNEANVNYKGKVNGDEIKFTVEIPGQDQTIEYIAKRVS